MPRDLLLHKNALCLSCGKDLKAKQPDGTEVAERWVCKAYMNRVPDRIYGRADDCKFYDEREEGLKELISGFSRKTA